MIILNVFCRHHRHGAVSIYNCEDVTIKNCTFYNNTASGYFSRNRYQGNSGGVTIGFSEQSSLYFEMINILITDCNFTLNSAYSELDVINPTKVHTTRKFPAQGGAISIIGSINTSLNSTITNNLFVENFAERSTGALYIITRYAGQHQYYCANNVFIKNSSPDGGAILFISGGSPELSVNFNVYNCTFHSNFGSVYSGALLFNFFDAPNNNVVIVNDCTFHNNSATNYAGAIDVASLDFFEYRNITPIRIENW